MIGLRILGRPKGIWEEIIWRLRLKNQMWLVSFKVRVLEGSPIDFDGSEFMYGEAATFSNSEERVKSEVLQRLEEGRLELVEVYNISLADEAKWLENSEDKLDILNLIEEVRATGVFAFGAFRSSEYLAGLDK